MENSRPKPGRMEETLEGGRGPPGAVEPLEREKAELERLSGATLLPGDISALSKVWIAIPIEL